MRNECDSLGHARTFNLARTAAQAFLRDALGKHDRLWIEVSCIKPLPTPPKYHPNPQTIHEARRIAEKLGPKAGPMFWTMCTTGMGPKEYFEDGFAVEGARVLIRGKKRRGRNRTVPLISNLVQPMLTRSGFRQALRRLDIQLTPYDARRTYANLLEAAGIPRTRRRMYLGHGAQDVTELYERHEVTQFLGEDAGKLRDFIGATRDQLRVMK